MKRAIIKYGVKAVPLLLILSLSFPGAMARERKKVGLVLGGGGAKGMAHVGVLKVLEKAGIPVDFIAGTSTGAVIGGLYAVGYDAAALDTIIRGEDWLFLLGDQVYRHDLPSHEKEITEKYLLSMPVRGHAIQAPAGIVSGQNIYNFFMGLTIGYHDSTCFDRLPIPFACVASNLVDGSEVILDRGVLAVAMRASMATPGVFSPVRSGDMVLVDGGMSNNFPVDVARAMGAEVLIGVDVQAGAAGEKGLESIMGIVDRLASLQGLEKHERNTRMLDLHVRPDVSAYPVASFSREAVAGLIDRGEEEARARWDDLLVLKEAIFEGASPDTVTRSRRGVNDRNTTRVHHVIFEGCDKRDERWLRAIARVKEGERVTRAGIHRAITRLHGTGAFARVDFRLSGEPYPDLVFSMEGKPASSLNVGFRFDSEEMVAILLNATFAYRRQRGSRLSLTGRLSVNPYATLEYSLGNTLLHRFTLSYTFKYNDLSLYYKGQKSDNVSFRYHRVALGASDLSFRNLNVQAGARYEYYDYTTLLHAGDPAGLAARPGGIFSYYAVARVETFDKRYYPTRGFSFEVNYALHTSNLYSYKGGVPFSALDFSHERVISLTRRVKLIPSLRGRVLIGGEVAAPLANYAGGMVAGRYVPQQIPFAGIRNMEPVDEAVVVARLQLRYRVGSKHYFSLVGNGLLQDDRFFDLLAGRAITGASLGYAYDSIIGPLSVDVDYSGWTREARAHVNIGYYF